MKVLFRFLAWVFIPIVIVEIVLRLFFPMHYAAILDSHQYDETLGFCAKAGYHVYVTDYRQELFVNNLRTINFQDDFNGYETFIFALGDSFTQGTGNPMDCSFPFQMDLILNLDNDGMYHKKYGVVNLGLAAFGAKQSLLALNRYVKLIGSPSDVLYLGCDNDALDDALFDRGYKHRGFIDGSPYWRWLVEPIQWMDCFQTFRYVKYIVMEIIKKKTTHNNGENNQPAISVAESQWPVIKKIYQECQKLGAKFILSWTYGEDSYHWLKAKAKKENIKFADWRPATENIMKNFNNLPFHNDHSGWHYRPWVMRIIAEEFTKHIVIQEDN